MHIGFRFEANSTVGFGHGMRCGALIAALTKRGHDCCLLTGVETLETLPHLASFERHDPDLLSEQSLDCVVVDHYVLNAEWEARAAPAPVVVIDDGPTRPHSCALLVDQTAGRQASAYEGLVPETCRFILGTEATLLRPEFLVARAQLKRDATLPPQRLMLSLGGGSYEALAVSILSEIVETLPELRITLAQPRPPGPELTPLLAAHPTQVSAAIAPRDMAALMLEADLAITGAGSTCWELACLGVPMIPLVLADNQVAVADAMKEAEAALLPRSNVPSDVLEALQGLINAPRMREALSSKGRRLIDGQGADRVAIAIEALIGTPSNT